MFIFRVWLSPHRCTVSSYPSSIMLGNIIISVAIMHMTLDIREDAEDAALGLTCVTGGMSYKDLSTGFINIAIPGLQ